MTLGLELCYCWSLYSKYCFYLGIIPGTPWLIVRITHCPLKTAPFAVSQPPLEGLPDNSLYTPVGLAPPYSRAYPPAPSCVLFTALNSWYFINRISTCIRYVVLVPSFAAAVFLASAKPKQKWKGLTWLSSYWTTLAITLPSTGLGQAYYGHGRRARVAWNGNLHRTNQVRKTLNNSLLQ